MVLTQILDLLNDESSSVPQLEEYFRRDAALAAKMLRLVNSPLFGLRCTVDTIAQAAAMVGYNTMRTMVLGAWVADFLSGEITPYGYASGGLWMHSIATSFVARKTAGVLKLASNAETLFLAGLLHDIGKLPLSQHTDEAESLASDSTDSPVEILKLEREHFGTDHADMGAEIAQRWNFPEVLSQTIRQHHTPGQMADGTKYAAVVHLADWCCNTHAVGLASARETPPPIDSGALDALGIQSGDLPAWIEISGELIAQVKAMEVQPQ